MRRISTVGKYVIAIGISLLVGSLTDLATKDGLTWYANLHKTSFDLPYITFGPLRMVRYVLMGIAMGRVWCRVEPAKADAPWSIYSAQLAFNGLWSIAFFSISVPYVSLVVILFLLVAVILCTRAFAKVDRTAGWLMVPYLLWVSFATLFNASLVFFYYAD